MTGTAPLAASGCSGEWIGAGGRGRAALRPEGASASGPCRRRRRSRSSRQRLDASGAPAPDLEHELLGRRESPGIRTAARTHRHRHTGRNAAARRRVGRGEGRYVAPRRHGCRSGHTRNATAPRSNERRVLGRRPDPHDEQYVLGGSLMMRPEAGCRRPRTRSRSVRLEPLVPRRHLAVGGAPRFRAAAESCIWSRGRPGRLRPDVCGRRDARVNSCDGWSRGFAMSLEPDVRTDITPGGRSTTHLPRAAVLTDARPRPWDS